jgi:hypothetical protein
MKKTVEEICDLLGNLYSYSDYCFFVNIKQGLDITMTNGYSEDKFESMLELCIYQLILTSLRSDHQTLFTFFYSIYFLKELHQFNELEWKVFIEGD